MRVGEPAGTATHSQESSAAVGTDDQESLLTLVVVFDQADGVEPCMLDVGVPPVRAFARPRGSPCVKATLTSRTVVKMP